MFKIRKPKTVPGTAIGVLDDDTYATALANCPTLNMKSWNIWTVKSPLTYIIVKEHSAIADAKT
jgi:hypothetical protein